MINISTYTLPPTIMVQWKKGSLQDVFPWNEGNAPLPPIMREREPPQKLHLLTQRETLATQTARTILLVKACHPNCEDFAKHSPTSSQCLEVMILSFWGAKSTIFSEQCFFWFSISNHIQKKIRARTTGRFVLLGNILDGLLNLFWETQN